MDPSTNTQYGSSDDITPSAESPTIIITIPPYIPNSYFEKKKNPCLIDMIKYMNPCLLDLIKDLKKTQIIQAINRKTTH